MDQNYVGILVSDLLHRKIPTGKTGTEDLFLYEEACALYGMKPCYIRLRELSPQKAFIHAYVCDKGKFKRRKVPYPRVIHNRAIFKTRSSKQAVLRIARSGTQVFNTQNRYSKFDIHLLLNQEEDIRPHLPETHGADLASLQEMRKKYPSLLIKPVNSSKGRGIMRMKLLEDGYWELQYPHTRTGKWQRVRFLSTFPSLLKERLVPNRYLIQQQLPLANYRGRPFDLRVSVQRGVNGEWQMTGIVGKVARQGAFLTNMAQGGQTFPLPHLLSEYPYLDEKEVTRQIASLSLRIADCLSRHLPGLADLGLDIGLTEEGSPMFIEANGQDQRYSFREAGMLEEWKATYRNPMAYAYFLSKRK